MAACIRGMRLTSCFDRFSPEGHAVKFGREERRSRVSRRPFLTHVCTYICIRIYVCVYVLVSTVINLISNFSSVAVLGKRASSRSANALVYAPSIVFTHDRGNRLDWHRMHAKHARTSLFAISQLYFFVESISRIDQCLLHVYVYIKISIIKFSSINTIS